jgi:hypothetical protein
MLLVPFPAGCLQFSDHVLILRELAFQLRNALLKSFQACPDIFIARRSRPFPR